MKKLGVLLIGLIVLCIYSKEIVNIPCTEQGCKPEYKVFSYPEGTYTINKNTGTIIAAGKEWGYTDYLRFEIKDTCP